MNPTEAFLRVAARTTMALAAATAMTLAFPALAADTKSVTCQKSCRIELKLVDGKPAVLDDPIVIAGASGRSRMRIFQPRTTVCRRHARDKPVPVR